MASFIYSVFLRHYRRMDYEKANRILSCVMDILQAERERQGLSLKKFGAMSGIDRTTIGQVETGKRYPGLILCLRLTAGRSPKDIAAI